jgi:hypothetical protein
VCLCGCLVGGVCAGGVRMSGGEVVVVRWVRGRVGRCWVRVVVR